MVWLPVLQPLCKCWSREEICSLFLRLAEPPGKSLPAAPRVSAWGWACSPARCCGPGHPSAAPFGGSRGGERGAEVCKSTSVSKQTPVFDCISCRVVFWAVACVVLARCGDRVPFRRVGLSCTLPLCAELPVC